MKKNEKKIIREYIKTAYAMGYLHALDHVEEAEQAGVSAGTPSYNNLTRRKPYEKRLKESGLHLLAAQAVEAVETGGRGYYAPEEITLAENLLEAIRNGESLDYIEGYLQNMVEHADADENDAPTTAANAPENYGNEFGPDLPDSLLPF